VLKVSLTIIFFIDFHHISCRKARKKKEFSTEKPLCCQGTLKPLKCHCVGFDPVIGKTVSAKYAGNLYHEIQHDNGDRYVVRIES